MGNESKTSRLVIGGAILLVLVLLLGGGIYFSSNTQPEPTPTPFAATLEDAQQLVDERNYSGALEMLEQIVASDTQNAEAYFLLGLANFNTGKYDEAKEAFNRSLEIDSSRAAAVHHNLGALAYQFGDFETAIEEFKLALEADPDDSDSHYQLGATYLVQSLPADGVVPDVELLKAARSEFEEALELDPEMPEAMVGLANVHMLFDQVPLAIELLEGALEQSPDMGEALFALGRAYAVSNETEKAKKTLQAFIETNPPEIWKQQAQEIIKQLEEQ